MNYFGEKSLFDKISLKIGIGDFNYYRCVERFISGCLMILYIDDEIYICRFFFVLDILYS